MKVDLNAPLTNLDGEPLKNEKGDVQLMNKLVSQFLSTSVEKDNALKYYEWSKQLHQGLGLELDTQDFDLLKKFISQHDQFFVLSRAQILLQLKKAELSKETIKKAS